MGADLDGAALTVWSRALGLELEKSWSRKLEDSGFFLCCPHHHVCLGEEATPKRPPYFGFPFRGRILYLKPPFPLVFFAL